MKESKSKLPFTSFLLLLAVIIIFVRFNNLTTKYVDGEEVFLSGQVLQEPRRYFKNQEVNISGVVVSLSADPQVFYGDFVALSGIFKDGKVIASEFKVNKSNFFLFRLRKNLLDFYRSSLPEPHSSLVIGMVLGIKDFTDFGFRESLRLTGTSHVVVASGMNVTLVAFFCLNFLILFINRRKALLGAVMLIWIYVLVAGFEAPLVRAAIMSSLVLIAGISGKIPQTLRVLVITALIMLIINPLWLIDIGFLLSFLATLGLILLEAKIDKKIQFVPSFLRSGFSTSFSAQIGVAPLLLLAFGFLSLVGLIVNPLVLWTVPYITIGGMIAGIIGVLIEPIGSFLILLIYPFTSWFIFVVNLFS